MLLLICCCQCVGDNNAGRNGVAAHVVRVFVTCHGVAKCAGMVLLGVWWLLGHCYNGGDGTYMYVCFFMASMHLCFVVYVYV